MKLSTSDLYLRAFGGQIITAEDYLFTNVVSSFQNDGNRVIQKQVVLTTINERFTREKSDAVQDLNDKKYLEFFQTLDRIMTYVGEDGTGLYYSVVKLYTDGVYSSLKDGSDLYPSNVKKIFSFEDKIGFSLLSFDQKYAVYLQMGRALLQSQYRLDADFNGTPLVDVVEHCYSRALLYRNDDTATGDRWILYKEQYDAFMRAGFTERAITLIDRYFSDSKIPKAGLSDVQKRSVIYFMAGYVSAIDEYKRISDYSEDDYTALVQNDDQLKKWWMTYADYCKNWEYLFPTSSKTLDGKKLRRYYQLASIVLS